MCCMEFLSVQHHMHANILLAILNMDPVEIHIERPFSTEESLYGSWQVTAVVSCSVLTHHSDAPAPVSCLLCSRPFYIYPWTGTAPELIHLSCTILCATTLQSRLAPVNPLPFPLPSSFASVVNVVHHWAGSS